MALHPVEFRIEGMDCGHCVAKVTQAAEAVPGVAEVEVSLAARRLRLMAEPSAVPAVEKAVRAAGYGVQRLFGDEAGRVAPTHHEPAYARALWIVVLINLGYGLIEIAGGLYAGSQAVKADALDFIGDGLITWLGLAAIAWGATARARTALVQGWFLGLLGLAVLGYTVWRFIQPELPRADWMGALGVMGFIANIASAAILLPHRKGDANMRAVWLFSRNDAIGNFAVVAAAVVVAVTGSRWPDLIVAVAIALLFLQSARVIVRDARAELDGVS